MLSSSILKISWLWCWSLEVLKCYSVNLHNNIVQFYDDAYFQLKVAQLLQKKCMLSVITDSSVTLTECTECGFDVLTICLMGDTIWGF